MHLEQIIKGEVERAIAACFELESQEVVLQPTRKDFEGYYTFVTFSLGKTLKKSPAEIAKILGDRLVETSTHISSFNVVQGFLNLSIRDSAWLSVLEDIAAEKEFGNHPAKGEKVLIEFSSPNTNKPLHLGHLRNNFLGDSVSRILKANGAEVAKVCLVNDRGIHICKSMLAYKELGNGETPESSNLKGDHFAGKYYVAFDTVYKQQIAELVSQGMPQEDAAKKAPWILKAQQMLVDWENGDEATVALWKQMNEWVYEGFNQTYKHIGISFDKTYYESDTYLLGKDLVDEGLAKGVFYKKEDGSVWIDLTEEGLDQKLVLRGNGTSVYITQDIGTTELKHREYATNNMIWVVGNEQDYHFEVLFAILKRLGRSYAEGCYHLSYGMVDLPSGKMKSREGTVVDADELVSQMEQTAEARTTDLGKIEGFNEDELKHLYNILALGALKYFLLKVDPKKRMLFNPEESIDFQGNTGPFIQYTHARIKSILRKADQQGIVGEIPGGDFELKPAERDLINLLNQYPERVGDAARTYSPALIATYAYDLAKTYNQFYAELSIFAEQNPTTVALRVELSRNVARTIAHAFSLLGIEVPERM
jgi:arginyl-tRNA synthetase